MENHLKFGEQKGQTAVAVIIIVLTVSMLIIVSRAKLIITYQKMNRNVVRSLETYYTTEAAIEDSLIRIVKPNLIYPATYSMELNNGSALVSITQDADGLTVMSQGNTNNLNRNVEVQLRVGTSGQASFQYGAQIGAGGLTMINLAQVIGNVYSGGNISGESGNRITGDAWAAGVSTISGFDNDSPNGIGVDAHANTIENSQIGEDIYYQNIIDPVIAGGSSYPGSANPPEVELPIAATQITSWQTEAALGGATAGYTLEGSDTDMLGPKKITGDMLIKTSAVLTITGTVWVTGNVTLQNNAAIQLHPSYGDASAVLMSDGLINMKNNFIVCGSEGFDGSDCNTPTASYLLLLSTSSANPAILMENGTALRAVLYASDGMLEIQNNARVVEATGYALSIKNNAQLIYEVGLINTEFSSGPGGNWEIASWKEVE